MRTTTLLAGAALVCAVLSPLGRTAPAGAQTAPAAAAPTPADAPADAVPGSAEDVRPLLVGSAVPDVSLPATDGDEVDLLAAAKAQPTILIFYRGGW